MSHKAALPPRPAPQQAGNPVASRSASDSAARHAQQGHAGDADSSVARLAQFFPHATPVRIPVRVTDGAALSENTVIEFGTPREVLFASTLPLEFADKLQLKNADGSLDTSVLVVAVQYHGGKTAVAARFADEIANWIVKP